MNIFSPAEIVSNYADLCTKKASMPAWKLLLLGVLGGFLIGMGSAVTNTATHAITNVSLARILYGLLFPFGLGMAVLLGAEVFVGNCMMLFSVAERKATAGGVFKNWVFVYLGNLCGAMLLAAGCVYAGQLNYSDGGLATHTIKVAVVKCSMPFGNAAVLGVFCNLLVCTAVLCALSAKDTIGKIAGSYLPIAFFVICGFENVIANMFYIPAGLFAMRVPAYAAAASAHGISTEILTWKNFFVKNLAPVTIGNIVGGAALGMVMWACYLRKPKRAGVGSPE